MNREASRGAGGALRRSGCAIGLAASCVLAGLAVPDRAAAQDPPAPASSPLAASVLVVIVEAGPLGIDPEQTRAAVARELGVQVTLAPAASEGQPNVLWIRTGPGAQVTVSYRTPDGHSTERRVDVPQDPGRRVELLALLAGNLVRDEAAELLATLSRRPPPEPPEPPPPEPPEPEPPPPPPPRLLPMDPISPCAVEEDGLPFGLDFLPYVGTSSVSAGRKVRRVAVGALGTLGASLVGVEAGGLVSVETVSTCGLQAAGMVGYVGGPLVGMQATGIVGVVRGPVGGVQVAGVANTADAVAGAQISGIVNVAGRVHGAQIGLVNVGEDPDVQIGLVSVARGGRTHLQLWGNESGLVLAALEHGGRHVHNLYGVGARVLDGRFVAALGIGAHAPLGDRLRIDVDFVGHAIFPVHFTGAPTELYQLRPTLGVRVVDGLTLFAGPTFNAAHDGQDATRADISPYRAFVAGTYRMWPGATLGVEAF